ncbi:MAG: ABC transporter ATP-binding protein [Flavobacteriaceae bacterium]|nr:ABC transporter ATP-binding protein [Flavobacteriaceae bacterium]CAI8330138.1 MAG: putative multidrug resistance ABC transporter ATP-binding/permease protein YheI [Flavobacteriaceae bacterium]
MKELSYINKYFFKYKKNLISGIIIIIAARMLLLITPGLIRNSINVIDDYRTGLSTDLKLVENELITNIFLILLASALAGLFTFLTRQTIINVSRYVEFDLKNEIYSQYQKLSLNFYKMNQTGDLMNRISEDVAKVRMYVGPALMYSINTITLLIIVVIYMYKQSPILTFYTLSPLPFLSITIYKLSKLINKKSTTVQECLSELSSFSQESFSGIRLIKSYSIEEKNSKDFDALSEKCKKSQISLVKLQALFFPLMILLIGLSNLLVIYVGGIQYFEGKLEGIGTIAEFIIYVNMLTWPVASLGWISSIIQQAEASQKRINEFLEQKSEIINKSEEQVEINGEIEFKNVGFTYKDTGIKALKDINFKLNIGDKLGIIGKTGSGKSTLLNLIVRLYNIDNGDITIDNKNIEEVNIKSLRSQIGYVPQDVFLFSDSIENNIKFGSINSSTEEVIEVSKISDIHNDILGFKNKYKTILGERGVNLSGGQKQRISIARALIRKPKLLIFDDCLSAVDTETEENIINSLNNLDYSTTSIIVSHRISSIKNANKIIVLNNGQIEEIGTHTELMEKKGYYKQTYEQQLIEKEISE